MESYTLNEIKKNIYLKDLLKDHDEESIFDPLTGLITRNFFQEYMKNLINKNIPFTFGIVDLDNFKTVNDNYGHHVGDIVLKDIAKRLITFIGEDGLAGRFGGDEFVFVWTGSNNYDDIHNYVNKMYHNNTIFRRNIDIGSDKIFVTATVGTSSFPNNAKTYNDLIQLSDKTLYRGKMKGRNCFIIYVKEKHENLEVKKMYRESIDLSIMRLYTLFDQINKSKDRGLPFIENYLLTTLRVQKLLYLDSLGNLYDLIKEEELFNVKGILNLFDENGFFIAKSSHDFSTIDKDIEEKLNKFGVESLLAVKMNFNKNNMGAILLAEKRFSRIWQADEKALLVVFARLYHEYRLKNDIKEGI